MWNGDARFKVLFYETGMGIALVDLERRILDVNPAFEKMLGYSRSELVGKTFAGLMYAEDNALNLKLHEELLSGKRDVYHMERRYIRKDTSLLWSRLTVSLLRDAEGKPSFTMGVMEDITEQRNTSAKLAEMERGFIENAKMSALGEMAGGIAHEIQNPLTIIRFRSELLKTLVALGGDSRTSGQENTRSCRANRNHGRANFQDGRLDSSLSFAARNTTLSKPRR